MPLLPKNQYITNAMADLEDDIIKTIGQSNDERFLEIAKFVLGESHPDIINIQQVIKRYNNGQF